MRRKTWSRRGLLIAAGALLVPTVASAQGADNYPARPVRIVIPYGPGGATDIVARIVFKKVGERLGASFVVESRPGANGAVASQDIASARADG